MVSMIVAQEANPGSHFNLAAAERSCAVMSEPPAESGIGLDRYNWVPARIKGRCVHAAVRP